MDDSEHSLDCTSIAGKEGEQMTATAQRWRGTVVEEKKQTKLRWAKRLANKLVQGAVETMAHKFNHCCKHFDR